MNVELRRMIAQAKILHGLWVTRDSSLVQEQYLENKENWQLDLSVRIVKGFVDGFSCSLCRALLSTRDIEDSDEVPTQVKEGLIVAREGRPLVVRIQALERSFLAQFALPYVADSLRNRDILELQGLEL